MQVQERSEMAARFPQETIAQVMGVPPSTVSVSATDFPVSATVSVETATPYTFGGAQQSAFLTGLSTDMGLAPSQVSLGASTQTATPPAARRQLARGGSTRGGPTRGGPTRGGSTRTAGRKLLTVLLTVPFRVRKGGARGVLLAS